MPDNPILPAHIEQTIETITELHRQHQRRATPSQKVVAQLTAAASQPRFVGLMTLVFALWIGANGLAKLAGYAPPDPPPYSYIQAVTGIAGVYVTQGPMRDGRSDFSGMVAPVLREGNNLVQLFAVEGRGADRVLRSISIEAS